MRLGITAFLTDGEMRPAELALAVEERGFSSFFLPHHSHLPVRAVNPPGLVGGVSLEDYKRGLDPIVALGFAGAATTRITLGTGVLLAAQLDPITLAKQVATLDHLTGGRTVLGVGAGWNRPEAEDHGVGAGQRWARLVENVACMRALWTTDVAEFHGRFIDLPACYSWPKPVQERVPVLIGGAATPTVFEAICTCGDGWLPIGGAGLTSSIESLRQFADVAGRDPDSLRIVPFGTIPDKGKLAHYASLGVHETILRLPNTGRDDMLGRLDSYAEFLE